MKEGLANDLYDYIRSYYNFYTPRVVFVDTYMEEFKDYPPRLVKQAIINHCKNSLNKQPPTVNDVKNAVLRNKWQIESDIIQRKLDGSLTAERLEKCLSMRDKLVKALNGYGSELEEEDARQVREYRNTYGEPKPRKPFTDEELQEAEEKLLSIGELYDL